MPGVNWAIWSRICQRTPLPANTAPNIGLIGGQCLTNYRVDWYVDYNPGTPQVVNNFVTSFPGPLTDVWISTEVTPNGALSWIGRARNNVGAVTQAQLLVDSSGAGQVTNPRWRVQRSDGLPDTCGNAPPIISLPPTPPATTFNTTIQYGPQIREVTVNLPTLDVGNWPNFSFSPTLVIEGTTFEFSTDGVEITFAPNFAFNNNAGPSVNTGPVTVDLSEVNQNIQNLEETVNIQYETLTGGGEVDLTGIIDLIRCCACEENVTYSPVAVTGNPAGDTFVLPEQTVAVVINGANLGNPGIRTQSGAGSAPGVYYWGWCAPCYGGSSGGERIPLQFESQSIVLSEGATGILVSPTYGATCSVIAIVKEKNCDVNGTVSVS